MLSETALNEFKSIYHRKFGVELSDEEAMQKAVSLLDLFNAIYRPTRKDWLDEFSMQMQTNTKLTN